MRIQAKLILLAAALGITSMFLPWGDFVLYGTSGNYRGVDIQYSFIPLACYILTVLLCFIKNSNGSFPMAVSWTIIAAGFISAAFVIWHLLKIDAGYTVRWGMFLASMASMGMMITGFIFSPSIGNRQ